MAALGFRLDTFALVPMLREPHDAESVLVFVRSRSAVGCPSWVRMLLKVYRRWAERMDFSVEWIDGHPDLHPSDYGEGMIRIAGSFAFGLLRGEAGVHRLTRIALEGRGQEADSADIEVLPDCALPMPPEWELQWQAFQVGRPTPYS